MAGGNRSAAAKKAWATRRRGGGVIGRANTMLRNRVLGGLALHSMKTKGGLAKPRENAASRAAAMRARFSNAYAAAAAAGFGIKK